MHASVWLSRKRNPAVTSGSAISIQEHIALEQQIRAARRGKRRVEPVDALDDAVGVSAADHVLVGEVVCVDDRVEHEDVGWDRPLVGHRRLGRDLAGKHGGASVSRVPWESSRSTITDDAGIARWHASVASPAME